MVDAPVDYAPVTGAAKRRRERRLRAYLRYARMSVAMVLAENNHHSAPRRPTVARAREEESDGVNNAMGQKTVLPQGSKHGRACLPPGRHLSLWCGHSRGFSGALVDILPYVQILDVPVPQMGNQVVEVLQPLDTATPEQVIEVPKLSQDRIPQCSAVRRPQKENSWCKCPRSCPSLLCSSRLPSRSSTIQFQVVEVLVDGEVFKVFPPDRIQQRGLQSRTLTFQFPEMACMFSLILAHCS